MLIKDGVILAGLDIVMRPVLVAAEIIWIDNGRAEGVTITSALDGVHSAGSLHYYGRAVDLRIRYFDAMTKKRVYDNLKWTLDSCLYDVVLHATHIHVEYHPKS
jgi:hypothetical protein